MHLPLLHISSRDFERPHDDDPLGLGTVEGKDFIPWLADARTAIERAAKRTSALDAGALGLAAVGSEVTYFAILGYLFAAYDRYTALSLAGVILPSVTINQVVKARFRFARPPRLARHPLAFVAPGDFTFPSGHAQNAVVLGVFLALRARRSWVRVLGVSLATLIPLSRVYLGVHYPRDVLAATLLGMGTLMGVDALEGPFKRWWERSPRGSRGFLLLYGCAIAGVLTGTPLAAFPLGVGGGMALGQDLSGQHRFRLDTPTPRARVAQGIIGVGTIISAGFVVRPLMKRENTLSGALAGSLVGIALTFGVPMFNNLARRLRMVAGPGREKRFRPNLLERLKYALRK